MYCKFICKNIQKSMVIFCSYVLLSFKKGHPQNNSTVPPTASSLDLDQGTCLNASTNACDKKNATYCP